jgi:hypothetical protein
VEAVSFMLPKKQQRKRRIIKKLVLDIRRLSARFKEEILFAESDMKSFIKSTELRIHSL